MIIVSDSLAKSRKIGPSRPEYINCDFILEYFTEVERIFNLVKYILIDNRNFMTPQLFEALLFLKVNERFWNDSLVSDAIKQSSM